MSKAETYLVTFTLISFSSTSFLINFYDPTRNTGFVWISSFLYLIILGLPFFWPNFQPSLFHPIVFYVFWHGFRGLIEGKFALTVSGLPYHLALTGHTKSDLDQLIIEAFLLESISFLCLYLGYSLFTGYSSFHLPNPTPSTIGCKAFFWLLISAFGLYIIAVHAGGILSLFLQRGLPSDLRISSELGGQWNYLAGIGTIIPLVWLASAPNAIKRSSFWLLVIAVLMIKFAATGSRGGTIGPLIMLGTIWILQHRKVPYKIIILGAFLAMTIVGFLGEFRSATQKIQIKDFESIKIETTFSNWLDSFFGEVQENEGIKNGQLAVLGKVPEEVPYLYGESYWSIPFLFIPNVLLPFEKPDAAGKLNAERIFKQPLTAIPPGPVGEAFWNFSYPGVIFLFFFYGAFLRIISNLFYKNPDNSLLLFVYVLVLFVFSPTTPAIYEFFQLLIPGLLIWFSFHIKSGFPKIKFRLKSYGL